MGYRRISHEKLLYCSERKVGVYHEFKIKILSSKPLYHIYIDILIKENVK